MQKRNRKVLFLCAVTSGGRKIGASKQDGALTEKNRDGKINMRLTEAAKEKEMKDEGGIQRGKADCSV